MENKKRHIGYFSQKHFDYLKFLPYHFTKGLIASCWFDKSRNKVLCTLVLESSEDDKENEKFLSEYKSKWNDVVCLGELDEFYHEYRC